MAKKISKNNPDSRYSFKLVVYCPLCEKEVKAVKQIQEDGNSIMIYRCCNDKCDFSCPLFKGSYKDLDYEWVAK